MAYNLRGSSGLRSSSKLRDAGDAVEPMASVANIVDAMLVLSLGLMIAIVSFWNVDLFDVQEMVQQDEVTEMEDVQQMANQMNSGNAFNELGTVYQDPSTGKLYMLTEDADKGATDKGKSSK